jgi:PTS system ascorbate-specific IIA component
MSVGLLLITHNRIGSELLATATTTFGGCPMAARALSVGAETDPDQLLADARELLHEINSGSGVLVLTDCFGSTPSNIANRLLDEGSVRIVSGVSLPMLIRVMNYARLALRELADKAVSGGYEGVVLSGPGREQPLAQ